MPAGLPVAALPSPTEIEAPAYETAVVGHEGDGHSPTEMGLCLWRRAVNASAGVHAEGKSLRAAQDAW